MVRVFLQFLLASVIGLLKRNPDKYNNLLAYNMPSSSTTTTTQQITIIAY